MINDVYHDKPLMFIRATFWKKLVSYHQAVNINYWIRLSLSRLFLTLYFDMINPAYYDNPLILIWDTFQEKLLSHRQAVNINYLIRLGLSRWFLAQY